MFQPVMIAHEEEAGGLPIYILTGTKFDPITITINNYYSFDTQLIKYDKLS